ncbi:Zn(II)2Cys6 transcription factor domain-containing protein [Aspergillus luchuensis]|uniref:Similar to An09g01310 n=1 Tax=Aspergillus kawachii TaxID=1069201 RepID=A0A146F3H4_ASPKA|nr:uncharacterized protein AKAW2_40119A [Aspergillus luchuensis]BCR98436.1 hypothetical protein AKAW2_40119A [Aspergillus luchuensis]BCS10776.1 hypothetical protein ALUC_40116A [Aspergillus luchuensis]GAA90209.1 similar to An09g01310 [Aspergillus luchuensis IFO 4308]GAT20666.1 similar to An09g01310 [Aspergillus luchuensis]
MQGQRAQRRPRGKYARLICRGCRARKIKCVLACPLASLGPLGTPQPPATCCERCRNLDLECIVESNPLGRPATKRANRGNVASNSPPPDTSNSPRPSPQHDEKAAKLSDSIQHYLFSGAILDDHSMLQELPDAAESTSDADRLYHAMANTSSFIAGVLAKDASFGSTIQLVSDWSTSLTDTVSHDLAATLDKLLAWHRLFLIGTPSLLHLRERLFSTDPNTNNVATKLLFAVLCLAACESSENVRRQNGSLRNTLLQAVSSYGQDFMFSPPTHIDSVAVCRFLSAFKPTALATSKRVASQSIKAELYLTIAYRIAERLGLLPEPGAIPFLDTTATDSVVMERELVLSIQGLEITAEEFLMGDFLTMTLQGFRQVLQRMQPHIDSYQMFLETHSCSPVIIFHVKWITATYMQIEAMANSKQSWMSPSRLFIVVEEGEKKCLAEVNSAYHLLSEAAKDERQNEVVIISSLLELRFHAVIAKIFGLGLFYISVWKARMEKDRPQKGTEIYPDEASQMGNTVINFMMTTPDSQSDSQFFKFLRQFGGRYPDKLQGILAKFIEGASMKHGGIDYIAPVRPIVIEVVNLCKNIVENNLIRLKGSGRLHPNFDKQLDLFKQCADALVAMVSQSGNSPEVAFRSGCMYIASSKMLNGLQDLMYTLKQQSSMVRKYDEAMGVVDTPVNTTEPFAMPNVQFSSFEAWNMWPYSNTMHGAFQPGDILDWGQLSSTIWPPDPMTDLPNTAIRLPSTAAEFESSMPPFHE